MKTHHGGAAPLRLTALLSLLWAMLSLPGLAAAQTPAALRPLAPADAALIRQTLAASLSQALPAAAVAATADDAALVRALLAYAAAQHGARLAPSQFPPDWGIRPAPYDATAAYAAALTANQLPAWIAGLAPSDPRYARLAQAYQHYREIADRGGWPALALGSALRPGDSGERVQALRARLMVEDAQLAPTNADLYDPALATAVMRAQARYGLSADGVAGPKTLGRLNVPADQRLSQIAANLERWRWVPRDLPSRRAELNTVAGTLAVQVPGQPALSMRVIAGKPATPTPMFADRITGVVFNPPWTVPAKIAADEIWPKIRNDPGYMAREGFVVLPNGTLRQQPGRRAALGLFKFELGNPYGVYLHDTPSRALFAEDWRLFSHGCMRLEKPADLAALLLAGDSVFTPATQDTTLAAGITLRASVHVPLPLYVVYWTAFFADDGSLNFRDDAYGWDSQLAHLLSAHL